MEYWQKLKDPRWQKLRLEAMQKSNFCCQVCFNNEKTLNVHHKEYFKGYEPWDYEVEQLCVLCEECHKETHDNLNFLKWVSSYLPLDGDKNRDEIAMIICGYVGFDFDGVMHITDKEKLPEITKKYQLFLYELGKASKENEFNYWKKDKDEN